VIEYAINSKNSQNEINTNKYNSKMDKNASACGKMNTNRVMRRYK
jgi:hypothetical protein